MNLRKPKPQATERRRAYNERRPQAFSYHANRSEQEYNLGRLQPREQDTRRKERLVRYWRQRLGVLVAGIIAIACILDILHLSATPKIIVLSNSSSGSFLQSTAVYQRAAGKLFASSILNANKITVNTDQVARQLQSQFPELSDVSITLPLVGHRPIVYVVPAMPGLFLTSAQSSFVLDSSGKVLAPATATGLSAPHLPTVTDQSGLTAKVGASVLPSDSVNFIKAVVAELQLKGIQTKSLVLPASAYELDVYPEGVGYYVKFNLHSADAMQQVGTYLALRQRLQSQNITPGAYIDVRVDGRAYYK